jgi:transcriptional regulator with XRE-family HTH domain
MAPPPVARNKIEARGIDWVCQQLEDGRSQRDIAKELGVDTMSLNRYLHDNPLHSARVLFSMEAGAQAFEAEAVRILDDARQEIRDDPGISGSIVALARERAQAAWRQASVRDPRRYSDRRTTADITVTHKHDVASLPTIELERMVQTLQLDNDTGEVSDH